MLIDKFPQSLLKSALKLVGEAQKPGLLFQKGEIVEGNVIKNLPGGRALVRLGGMELIALTQAKLRAGQIIVGKVEQTSPNVTIGLLQSANGKEQKVADLIRLLIPGKAPVGDSLSKANAQGEGNYPPQVQKAINQLSQAYAKVSELSLNNMTANQAKEAIARSGLFLESALKEAVLGKFSQEQVAAIIKGDIKAQLAQAFKTLETEIARLTKELELEIKPPAEGKTTKPETAGRRSTQTMTQRSAAKEIFLKSASGVEAEMADIAKLRETAKEIKNTLNNIELNQLLNSAPKREGGAAQNNFNLYQIPFLQGDILETARVYLQPRDEDREGGGKKKSDESSIVFMLNMSKLGPVRVDVRVGPKRVTGSVYVVNDAVASFVRDNLPEIVKSLEAAGYNAWFEVATANRKQITEELEDFTPITQKGLINIKA